MHPITFREFTEAVELELQQAWKLFPEEREFVDLHHGYGVLLEEVDELWDLVRLKAANRDPARVYRELVQIAAMACKIALSRSCVDLGQRVDRVYADDARKG